MLDNCEHLIDACARLAQALLEGCPDLRILAISREALHLPGKLTPAGALAALPNPGCAPTPEHLASSEAVHPDRPHPLGSRASPQRRERGRGGRGLPAARRHPAGDRTGGGAAPALAIEQLAARLDEDALALLAAGGRTAPSRQQTLRATLDWSYDLLSGPERRLLGRLAAFAGGFALEAAEAVGARAGDDAPAGAVLDLLAALTDKSLVVVADQSPPGRDTPGGEVRFRLETVRQYGQERSRRPGRPGRSGTRTPTTIWHWRSGRRPSWRGPGRPSGWRGARARAR